MGKTEYVPLYIGTKAEAGFYNEASNWELSFRENVCCARAIEKAIRDSVESGDGEHIRSDCAAQVLDAYGFKRTCFVLAHSIRTLGPLVKASKEAETWSWQFDCSRDGNYGRYYRADTALSSLEEFIGQVQAAYQSLGLLGREQCDPAAWEESLVGRVLVLSPNTLRESCWSDKNMLWLATGGFGTEPKSRGRAVYATCLDDGEETRWNREDFLGVLDEKFLPDWAREKLAVLRPAEQEQGAAPVMG